MRQCRPARSRNGSAPIPPPYGRSAFVVSKLTMPVRDAGLWQDPPVCSQTEQVTRLAATDAAEPPLEPVVSRSVSYGLQVVPPHEPRDAEPRKFLAVEAEPPGLPLP